MISEVSQAFFFLFWSFKAWTILLPNIVVEVELPSLILFLNNCFYYYFLFLSFLALLKVSEWLDLRRLVLDGCNLWFFRLIITEVHTYHKKLFFFGTLLVHMSISIDIGFGLDIISCTNQVIPKYLLSTYFIN